MSDLQSNINNLSEKLQTLSADQITQVEDFVEFLRSREQDQELIRSAPTMSSPAFQAIWDNQEDDVYDAL